VLTPEREAEIRLALTDADLSEDWLRKTASELFVEIDRLRAEIERLKTFMRFRTCGGEHSELDVYESPEGQAFVRQYEEQR